MTDATLAAFGDTIANVMRRGGLNTASPRSENEHERR
jgi:hypothetical protein